MKINNKLIKEFNIKKKFIIKNIYKRNRKYKILIKQKNYNKNKNDSLKYQLQYFVCYVISITIKTSIIK